ncbi:MAG TPA: hypothetical protein VJ927_02165 [Actinomycetota bacterium]|nr:hypothetical protein [Actinomycetota bacterium]
MKKALIAVSSMLALALTAGAALAEYSPTLEFGLSDTKAKANPEITIKVAQEAGEEELGHVTLTIPKGFDLPSDEEVAGGSLLGTADLAIDAGPGCHPSAGGAPLKTSAPFSDRSIYEQDRDDAQADEGIHAVWVVDLQPVTTIPLEVTGSIAKGWKLDGDIPANDFTCPPLTFDGTIFSETQTRTPVNPTDPAGEAGVPILTNPAKPGKYVFGGTLSSATSPDVLTIKQVIKITK